MRLRHLGSGDSESVTTDKGILRVEQHVQFVCRARRYLLVHSPDGDQAGSQYGDTPSGRYPPRDRCVAGVKDARTHVFRSSIVEDCHYKSIAVWQVPEHLRGPHTS